MKVSSSTSRIKAIHLGEVTLNLIRMDQVPIKAKFALLDEEGNACGFFEKNNSWSDKVVEALQALASAMEDDAMSVVFLEAPPVEETTTTDEPPQF